LLIESVMSALAQSATTETATTPPADAWGQALQSAHFSTLYFLSCYSVAAKPRV